MLTAFELPTKAYGHTWSIRRFSGELVRHQTRPTDRGQRLPLKVLEALKFCDSPFELAPSIAGHKYTDETAVPRPLTDMHRRLLGLGNRRFLLSRLYASHQVGIFTNTTNAMHTIARLQEQREQRHQLCLQRTLLAAKTSKTFSAHGVIFIGAFLPTASMHAWIIESGRQPDRDDRAWVNYRPLLALCHP